jgi:hypothetical protein
MANVEQTSPQMSTSSSVNGTLADGMVIDG